MFLVRQSLVRSSDDVELLDHAEFFSDHAELSALFATRRILTLTELSPTLSEVRIRLDRSGGGSLPPRRINISSATQSLALHARLLSTSEISYRTWMDFN